MCSWSRLSALVTTPTSRRLEQCNRDREEVTAKLEEIVFPLLIDVDQVVFHYCLRGIFVRIYAVYLQEVAMIKFDGESEFESVKSRAKLVLLIYNHK